MANHSADRQHGPLGVLLVEDDPGDVLIAREALKAGQLYVQINSQKAPAPSGNLWGWFLIAHETVGQDVPEENHWFLPQYDMPLSAEHGSTHDLKPTPNT